jgi:hypothetical protein
VQIDLDDLKKTKGNYEALSAHHEPMGPRPAEKSPVGDPPAD